MTPSISRLRVDALIKSVLYFTFSIVKMRPSMNIVFHAVVGRALGQFVAAPADLKTANGTSGTPVRFK